MARRKRPPKKNVFIPTLGPEHLALTQKLEALGTAIGLLQQQIEDARATCTHAIAYEEDGRSWCEVCGEDFGWACPKSPDHTCHYFSERVTPGMEPHVKLHNGGIAYLSSDHYEEDETDDCCLFCHDPNERK